ncbi:MAG: succinylglutamate desuccinylase/aspartoacylase family protein [Chitinophagales bacterium]
MKILDHQIELGKTVTLKMDIAKLPTRSKIEVPIIVSRGKKPGPCLLLMAGIHGDEVNGIEIVRQIVASKYNQPESGTIICIPILNVFGFIHQTREFPDGRDLNRVFPGAKKGSLASRFAYHIMTEIIPHVDYCIDYHTGGGQRFNYTHLRLNSEDEKSMELAQAFAPPFIMHAKNREKSFRDSMVKLGKKVILFEGGKSMYLDKYVTKVGVEGAIRVIDFLGMRDFSLEISNMELAKTPIIIQNSSWVRARHSGMFRSFVSVGDKVEKGEKLGSISDPFGTFEHVVKNPKLGYVLNSNHAPVVNQGSALFNIGYSQ